MTDRERAIMVLRQARAVSLIVSTPTYNHDTLLINVSNLYALVKEWEQKLVTRFHCQDNKVPY